MKIMFLQLAHTKPNVFQYSQTLAPECYKVTKQFPTEEKFVLIQQIRRAAISVHLNIAEVAHENQSKKRKRFFKTAGGSVIEIDTAVSIAYKLNYFKLEELRPLAEAIIKTLKMISGMISP